MDSLEPILDQLTKAPAAGFAMVFGLLLALWSASGYVAAFSRGMNRVYEIDEGRPIWKLRPALLLVTIVLSSSPSSSSRPSSCPAAWRAPSARRSV